MRPRAASDLRLVSGEVPLWDSPGLAASREASTKIRAAHQKLSRRLGESHSAVLDQLEQHHRLVLFVASVGGLFGIHFADWSNPTDDELYRLYTALEKAREGDGLASVQSC